MHGRTSKQANFEASVNGLLERLAEIHANGNRRKDLLFYHCREKGLDHEAELEAARVQLDAVEDAIDALFNYSNYSQDEV